MECHTTSDTDQSFIFLVNRDECNFSPEPDAFIPERWLAGSSDTKWHMNKEAFIPFSYGSFGFLSLFLLFILVSRHSSKIGHES